MVMFARPDQRTVINFWWAQASPRLLPGRTRPTRSVLTRRRRPTHPGYLPSPEFGKGQWIIVAGTSTQTDLLQRATMGWRRTTTVQRRFLIRFPYSLFYAPFSFPQLTFLFHFAFANIVSNFCTRNPSTGRPSPIMSWTAELGRFTTPTTTRSSSTGSRTQATRTTTGSAWVSCQMWTATRLSRTRGATLERVFTCIMWEARSMQSASVILLYSCRYSN